MGQVSETTSQEAKEILKSVDDLSPEAKASVEKGLEEAVELTAALGSFKEAPEEEYTEDDDGA